MFRVALSIQTFDIPAPRAKQIATALNVQLRDHFLPAWHIQAQVFVVMGKVKPDDQSYDAVLVIQDTADIDSALGYHDRIISTGRPVGFVFEDICADLGEPVSVTASHELLEMVLNSHVNNYVIGPHPVERKRFVMHWKEACDAVQDQSYTIGKIPVSDFVLPLFFTPEQEVSEKVNFLETPGLRSFDCTAGGYLGFYDPKLGTDRTYFRSDLGRKRSEIKDRMKRLRRRDRMIEIISQVQSSLGR